MTQLNGRAAERAERAGDVVTLFQTVLGTCRPIHNKICACVCKCLHFEFPAENTSNKAISRSLKHLEFGIYLYTKT